jgi:mannose-6-phosphate isomerase class I
MEAVEEQYMKGIVGQKVRKYYNERLDNIVIAFGSTGYRILASVKPLQTRKTSYISVQPKKEKDSVEKFSERFSEISLEGPEEVRVSLMSKEEFDYRRTKEHVDNSEGFIDSKSINMQFIDLRKNWYMMSKEIFNTFPKSNSYILMSALGGTFSQAMHISFASLLNEVGLPHLDVAVVPFEIDGNKKQRARKALRVLKNVSKGTVVYDNDKVIEKLGLDSGNPYNTRTLSKINERIASDVGVFSAKLANRSSINVYKLTY